MSKLTNDDIKKFDKVYKDNGEKGFWDKVQNSIKSAGVVVISRALLLFYSIENIPPAQKALVYGSLGFFILPIDVIPDMYPVVGFTDDLAALMCAYKIVKDNITDEARDKTRDKLSEWFPTLTQKEIDDLVK